MIRALFLLLLVGGVARGQTRLTGVVSNEEDGKGVAGLSVLVRETPDGRILAFGTTGSTGTYALVFESKQDSVVLAVSGLSIRKYTRTLVNKSTTLAIRVMPEAIRLKEVRVTPPRIRKQSDTISYRVDGFTDRNDRTIGDVLKKMPGISVKDNGQILYNNRPINKFYIEGKDLLQGRYGVATNNLEAKDVAAVQVLENHQPVRIQQNREFSEDAALNLRLTDSAKGVLTAKAQLGAGLAPVSADRATPDGIPATPVRWDNELTTLFFNRQSQWMGTYKGNNAGRDVTVELSLLYPGQTGGSRSSLLAVQSPAAPGISARRYLFNASHSLSLNKLWSKAQDQQTTLLISYLNDRRDKSSYALSEYYRPDTVPLRIEERVQNRALASELDASLQINRNKDRYFLENNTRLTGRWNQERGTVSNQLLTQQTLRTPGYGLSNAFHLIRNRRKGQVSIQSANRYEWTPHQLVVSPPAVSPLFDTAVYAALRQGIDRRDFSSKNSVGLSLGKGAFQQNYSLNVSTEWQQLQSSLDGRREEQPYRLLADSLRNNLHWNRTILGANPSWTLRQGAFRATLSLALQHLWLSVRGQQQASQRDFRRLFFNPSFWMQCDLSRYLNLTASAGLTAETAGIERAFDGFILETYRSLRRNEGDLPWQRNQSYGLNLNYRNPIRSLFGTLGGRYTINRRNLLYAYDYLGVLSLSRTYALFNTVEGQGLTLNLSKGIDALNATVRFNASYDRDRAVQLTDRTLIPFQNHRYLLNPAVSSRLGTGASLSYQFRYGQSRYRVEGGSNAVRPVRNSAQEVQLSVFPAKGFVVNVGHEFFATNAVLRGSRRMHFADLSLKYKTQKYELMVEGTNLFNVRRYLSASNDGVNTFTYSYALRPAQLLATVRFKLK